jgi:hypothetical protein
MSDQLKTISDIIHFNGYISSEEGRMRSVCVKRMGMNRGGVFSSMLSILALALFVFGCFAETHAEGLPKPAVTVKWLPALRFDSDEPYFAVNMFADGRIVFSGGAETRERDEREFQIGKDKANELMDFVKKVMNQQKPMSGKYRPNDQLKQITVEIAKHDSSNSEVVRVLSSSIKGQEIRDKLDTLIHVNALVCPARYMNWDRNRTGVLLELCQQRPVIRYAFPDDNACQGAHHVDLFGDGTVHYRIDYQYVFRGEARFNASVDGGYFTLSNLQLNQLVKTIKQFNLSKQRQKDVLLSSLEPTEEYLSYYMAINPDDLKKFNKELTDMTGITWISLPKDIDACKSNGIRSHLEAEINLVDAEFGSR